MRAAIANNVTVGSGTWITPFTPILSDVGSQEMWEGAPRAPQRPLHGAEAHGEHLPVHLSDLVTGDPQHPGAGIHILLAQCSPRSRDLVVCARLHTRWRSGAFRSLFQGDATFRDRLAPGPLRVHHHLGHRHSDLLAGLPLHSLHGRFAGTVSLAGVEGRSPHVQNEEDERHPEIVDLDHHGAVPASARRRALPAGWAPRSATSCSTSSRSLPLPTSGRSGRTDALRTCSTMALSTSSCASFAAQNFFSGNNCVAEYGHFPSNFLLGVSTAANDINFRRQMRSRLSEGHSR